MQSKSLVSLMFALLLSSLLYAGSTLARSLPEFTELARDNSASVVNISTSQTVRSTQLHRRFGLPDDMQVPEMFRRFFEDGMPQLPERHGKSLGSGFIISEDGYILTNHHVVDAAETVEVRLSDRRVFEAEIIGSDKDSDVALIKIEASGLPVVKIGSSSELQVGEWVLAIGSPFGFDHTVTAGIVSAKGRSLPNENYVPFIQTDVAINPGNSGGPLFNLDGEVVGVNSQIYSRTGGFMGLSFAIPIDLAMDVAKQIRENGSVARGYLGVLIQDVDRDLAESFGLDQPRGALVSRVLPDTPAADAGLEVGDIIVSFNGRAIQRSGELPPMVGAAHVEEDAELEVIRNGESLRKRIRIAQLPSNSEDAPRLSQRPQAPGRIEALGLTVSDLNDEVRQSSGLDEGGALITEVDAGAGRNAGLQRGDVVKMFNRQRVSSAQNLRDLAGQVSQGSTVAVLILRDGDPMFVPLRVDD